MSSISFKNVTDKIYVYKSYTWQDYYQTNYYKQIKTRDLKNL